MRSGDVVSVDFGVPQGSEPGFVRPAVVVTADAVLEMHPRTVHVIPITSNVERRLPTEVALDELGLARRSSAQVHLCTVISTTRIVDEAATSAANVGPVHLAQLRSVLGDLLDIS